MRHGTLDEDAYDQGDWEEKQSHWSRQRLHMDQNVINPTCCKTEWPLHYLVRTICYLKSWNYGLYGDKSRRWWSAIVEFWLVIEKPY
mgnify:CR=1 FL=1